MDFPKLTDAQMLARLEPPTGVSSMVLDTDTYNEIDDQFCLMYALLSTESVEVETDDTSRRESRVADERTVNASPRQRAPARNGTET